jgi:hypothetical protein
MDFADFHKYYFKKWTSGPQRQTKWKYLKTFTDTQRSDALIDSSAPHSYPRAI